ncbi:MAG: hypothetical protein EBS19_15245 [Spirochaetia bacterium]|nr:hypothetical protein [Spirochaetia bacterium]
MKLKKIKEEPATRTVFEFKHKGKKHYYTFVWTSTESEGMTDESIFDENWNRVEDEMLLDKIICTLWPESDSLENLEKVLQEN